MGFLLSLVFCLSSAAQSATAEESAANDDTEGEKDKAADDKSVDKGEADSPATQAPAGDASAKVEAEASPSEEALTGAETDTEEPEAEELEDADEESSDEEGDDFFASQEASLGFGGLTYELGGHLRGDAWIGKIPDLARPEVKAAYGEAALKLKVSKKPYGDAVGELRVRSGWENDELDTRLSLREAYVNSYVGPLKIQFGHQIIVWGRADGINPTNNLTPIDLRVRSPEEDDRRMANLALRLTLNWSIIRLEGAWVPLYIPNEFPNMPIPEGVRLIDPALPKPDLANGTEAVRFHLLLPAVEMSVSYLYGYSLFPGLVYVTEEDDTTILTREAWQQHVAGFDFSAPVKDLFVLRGEIAYRYPIDYDEPGHPNIPSPDLYYIAGADKEIGDVHVIAEYMGRYVFDWTRYDPDVEANQLRFRNQLIHFQREKIQHGMFLRVNWTTLNNNLSLGATGVMLFSTLEWLIYPKLSYSITDDMTVSVGAEVYRGVKDTLFNLIEDVLTAGYAELKISF